MLVVCVQAKTHAPSFTSTKDKAIWCHWSETWPKGMFSKRSRFNSLSCLRVREKKKIRKCAAGDLSCQRKNWTRTERRGNNTNTWISSHHHIQLKQVGKTTGGYGEAGAFTYCTCAGHFWTTEVQTATRVRNLIQALLYAYSLLSGRESRRHT